MSVFFVPTLIRQGYFQISFSLNLLDFVASKNIEIELW